jgi:diguanylate cyclase (GGDEF)-like protein
MKVLAYVQESEDQRCFERLKEEGYQVVRTFEEETVRDYLEKAWTQVVILDLDVAEKDFVSQMRRKYTDDYIYLIGLIASDDDRLAQPCPELLVDEFIIKPVEPDELIARLAIVYRYMQTLTHIRTKSDSPEPLRDVLTGTFSRPAIEELLYTEINRAKRMRSSLSLALVEITNLEQVWNRYGREIVDRAMMQTALKIWSNVRPYDLIGRWDDHVFLVVLPETPLNGALTVVERIERNITNTPLTLSRQKATQLDVSIGVTAQRPSSPSSEQPLLDAVDRALQSARDDENKSVVVLS